ncbi:MAG: hypothetical protein V1838_03020 [Patescibacteria group bacterium]
MKKNTFIEIEEVKKKLTFADVDDAFLRAACDLLGEVPHKLAAFVKEQAGLPIDEPLDILSLKDAEEKGISNQNKIAAALLVRLSTLPTAIEIPLGVT